MKKLKFLRPILGLLYYLFTFPHYLFLGGIFFHFGGFGGGGLLRGGPAVWVLLRPKPQTHSEKSQGSLSGSCLLWKNLLLRNGQCRSLSHWTSRGRNRSIVPVIEHLAWRDSHRHFKRVWITLEKTAAVDKFVEGSLCFAKAFVQSVTGRFWERGAISTLRFEWSSRYGALFVENVRVFTFGWERVHGTDVYFTLPLLPFLSPCPLEYSRRHCPSPQGIDGLFVWSRDSL